MHEIAVRAVTRRTQLKKPWTTERGRTGVGLTSGAPTASLVRESAFPNSRPIPINE
jgi:hypothetical protein